MRIPQFLAYMKLNNSIYFSNGKKMEKLIRFFKDEEGATAVEYGLMVALIAVVIIGVVSLLGTNLSTKFNNVATRIQN
jgi:pilus assembly protein Flp/PilA